MYKRQVIAGLITAAALLHVAVKTDWTVLEQANEVAPTTQTIGERIMSTYILPFEIVSLLLLVALVGATFIARRGGEEEES